jgi:hypothetical protein
VIGGLPSRAVLGGRNRLFRQHRPLVRKASRPRLLEPLFKTKWSNYKLECIAAQRVGGSIIVAASRWSTSFTDATGKTARHRGDAAQTFEKMNGQWRLRVANWNALPDTKQLRFF